jgi:hypothetical protein
MKTIHEMTHEEKISITEDQLNTLIDIEIAKAGIPFATYPGEEPQTPAPTLDVKSFEIAGIAFSTKEAAEAIADAIRSQQKFLLEKDYCNYDYSRKIARAPLEHEIDAKLLVSVSSCFSPQGYLYQKDILQKTSQAKSEYQEALKQWKKFDERRSSIASAIRETHYEARSLQNKIERMMSELDRYRKLAEGDENVALTFFEAAYGSDLTLEIRARIFQNKASVES